MANTVLKRKQILFFWLLFTMSIGFNILCVSPYVAAVIKQDNTPFFNANISDEELISAVANASMNFKKRQMILQENHGLFKDLQNLFWPSRQNIEKTINNYYTAYNYAGLCHYAITKKDSSLLNFIKKKADSWITNNNALSYEFTRVDQVPIGLVFLDLYRETGLTKYFTVAQSIFIFLQKKATDNIIPYANSETKYIDALGMFIPFLMEYYEITKDKKAKEIASANIIEFMKYGVDEKTHIPTHGFNNKTKIKVGSSNWGRGIGWYLLALAYYPEIKDSTLQNNIEQMNYTQFPLSSHKFDCSTALMFELFKHSRSNGSPNLNFIKPHIRQNGIVSDCSGDTYDLNDYSHSFGNSELCNGLLLLLYSKYLYNQKSYE